MFDHRSNNDNNTAAHSTSHTFSTHLMESEEESSQCDVTNGNSESCLSLEGCNLDDSLQQQPQQLKQQSHKTRESQQREKNDDRSSAESCGSTFNSIGMENNLKESLAENKRHKTELAEGSKGIAFHSFRDACGRFINNSRVQTGIIFLIILNALLLGVGTFDFVADDERVSRIFSNVDLTFLVVFTIEIALQLIYHGLRFVRDGWLCFDFVVVLLSWSLDSLNVFRAFRAMRAMRLVSRLKSLKNLLVALFRVGPSVTGVLALLVLITYIYGVLCTELFRNLYAEGYTDEDYFGSLGLSIFTLLQMVTLDWSKIVRGAKEKYPWSGILFMVFLVQTSFILYSLVIAIICDAVKAAEHQEDKDAQLEEEMDSRKRLAEMQSNVLDLKRNQQEAMESLQKVLEQVEKLSLVKQDSNNLAPGYRKTSGRHAKVFSSNHDCYKSARMPPSNNLSNQSITEKDSNFGCDAVAPNASGGVCPLTSQNDDTAKVRND